MPFSKEHIEQLAKLINHKITFDGFDYWWYSRLDGKWGIQSINSFKDYKKAYHYIYYWLGKYRRKAAKNDSDFDILIENVKNEIEIYDVVKKDIPTLDKVIEIHSIKPNANQTEIADYLGKSKMAISKHFKKLKYA